MKKEGKAWLDEADIGSGEKKSGDRDTEREISKIKKPGKSGSSQNAREVEKHEGLVDEEHPFPSKGN